MIESLFARLRVMEEEGRFDGAAYPPGLEPFPRRLTGQGFFPGGDGLWREGDSASLRGPSQCQFPLKGIMCLGNDFGSKVGFSRLGIYENPPTWRHLRRRFELADIPGQRCFFTNAYMGLRADRGALDHPIVMYQYDSFCAEFLEFQILTQQPRLIVVLGDRPLGLLRKVIPLAMRPIGRPIWSEVASHQVLVVTVSHPYSDLNKTESGKAAEGLILRSAWKMVHSTG